MQETILKNGRQYPSHPVVARQAEPNFKLLRIPGINSPESIAYKLSPLSEVIEQVTPQQCPLILNDIYIRVLRGHGSIYSMGAGKYLL